MPANLPDRVVRLLSFHGPVELWTGRGEKASTAKVHIAPFDNEIIAFVPTRALQVDGLLQTPKAVLTARAEDRRYTLRLEGVAMAGRSVASHPRRAALEPWMPEGSRPDRLLAIPFVAHEIELIEDDGQVKNRFAGPTPLGKAAPSHIRSLFMTAYGGGGRLPFITGLAGVFVWLGYLGSDYPWRPLALAVGWASALGMIAGIRMLGQAAAFLHWRDGNGDLTRAPTMAEGLVAPGESRMLGFISLGLGVLCLGLSALWPRGMATVAVILLSSGAPLLAVAWWLHSAVASRGLEKH
ncbi:MAG: hypothetical protein H6742_06235 [Alphaproteobacteria bacterium]|nr:hypothetical protein [Alphaproteobacteria bacterium]